MVAQMHCQSAINGVPSTGRQASFARFLLLDPESQLPNGSGSSLPQRKAKAEKCRRRTRSRCHPSAPSRPGGPVRGGRRAHAAPGGAAVAALVPIEQPHGAWRLALPRHVLSSAFLEDHQTTDPVGVEKELIGNLQETADLEEEVRGGLVTEHPFLAMWLGAVASAALAGTALFVLTRPSEPAGAEANAEADGAAPAEGAAAEPEATAAETATVAAASTATASAAAAHHDDDLVDEVGHDDLVDDVPAAAAPADGAGAAASSAADPAHASKEEIAAEARAAELQATAGLSVLYEAIVPHLLQGQRVQNIVQGRMDSARTRIPGVLQEELRGGITELTDALAADLPVVNLTNTVDLPSMSLLLAALAAPGQLKWLHTENMIRMGITGFLFSMDAIALILGHGYHCPTIGFMGYVIPFDTIRPWMSVDCTVLGVTLGVSLSAFLACKKTLEEIETSNSHMPDLPADPEEAFRVTIEHHIHQGIRAMLQYDKLTASSIFLALPATNLFDFFWQIGGWFLFFDTPSNGCHAKFMLFWARGRGMVFLIGLIGSLVGLGLTAVKLALNYGVVNDAFLYLAHDIDKANFPNGPPVARILVRSFLCRDTADINQMQLQILRSEETMNNRDIGKATAERDRLSSELEGLEQTKEDLSRKIEQVRVMNAEDSRERELLDQYRQALHAAMETGMQATTVTQVAQQEARAFAAASAAANTAPQAAGATGSAAVGGLDLAAGLQGLQAAVAEDGGLDLAASASSAVQQASSAVQEAAATAPTGPGNEGGGAGADETSGTGGASGAS